jgi:hypothetical protein
MTPNLPLAESVPQQGFEMIRADRIAKKRDFDIRPSFIC